MTGFGSKLVVEKDRMLSLNGESVVKRPVEWVGIIGIIDILTIQFLFIPTHSNGGS